MIRLWTWREISVPPEVVWELLTDVARWPDWGPTILAADVSSGPLDVGARGTVTTIAGVPISVTVVITLNPGISRGLINSKAYDFIFIEYQCIIMHSVFPADMTHNSFFFSNYFIYMPIKFRKFIINLSPSRLTNSCSF